MSEKGFTAFISYRHQSPDQDVAKRLHTAIETYRIPGKIRKRTGREKMGRVFRDQEELPLSSDLGQDIEDALDRSEWLIAVCSPRYLESRWCMRELEYFIEKKGKDHVLTILTEGEPQDSFPEILQFREDENGVPQPVEPLAADVRAASVADSLKKLKGEKLRLLAPVLGVSYDDLRERERQRRIKRILSMAAAFAIFAGVLTGILIRNANLRRIAEEQRIAAEEQQRIAGEERKRAEEEQRRAEEERLAAVSNSIGEALQKASAAREDSDRRESAAILLDALNLSGENDGMRREEIISQLRRTMYIEPFTVVSKLDLQNARLTNAAMAPDGRRAVCIANGSSVAVLDLEQSKVAFAVSKGNEQVDYVGFSPDGSRFVAIYDYYHYATVWNTEDGSEVFTYTSKTDEKAMVVNALFFGDSDTLLIQDHDRLFRISLADAKEELFYTLGEQQDGYDETNNLYTFLGGKPLNEIITNYDELYTHVPLLVSQDGKQVLVGGLAGKTGMILLDETGKRISLLDRMSAVLVDHYAVSPDGRYVCCISPVMRFMGMWETETGRLRYINKLQFEDFNSVSKPVFSPDSQKVAYIVQGRLTVADAAKGKEQTGVAVDWIDPAPPTISWSHDGGYIFCFTPSLYFIDAGTGETLLYRYSDMDDMYNNAVPAGDDLVLVTRGGGEALLYSQPGAASVVFAGEYTGELTGYNPLAKTAAAWVEPPAGEHQLTETFMSINGIGKPDPELFWSREGDYAAIVHEDGCIEVFRKEDPDTVYLQNDQFTFAPVAFGIVGDTLAASDRTSRMMFVNLKDGTMKILKGDCAHNTFVFSGNILMASRGDGCGVDVYDVETAELLYSMTSPVPFQRMGFSEDGGFTVAVTGDGRTTAGNLWQNESALLEAARRFAPGH